MASFVQAIGVHNKVSDVTSVTHIVAYLYQHRFTPKHGEVSPTTCRGGEGEGGGGGGGEGGGGVLPSHIHIRPTMYPCCCLFNCSMDLAIGSSIVQIHNCSMYLCVPRVYTQKFVVAK